MQFVGHLHKFNAHWQVAVILAVLLSSCTGQVTPVATPTAGNTVLSSPSPLPTMISAVTATPAPSSSSPTLIPTILTEELPLQIPVTGPTSPASENGSSMSAGAEDTSHRKSKSTKFVIPVVNDKVGFKIPVTGFSPSMITKLDPSLRPFYDVTDLILVIPALGLKIPIVGVDLHEGKWDVSWLLNQAGWLEGTAYPTHNGNSIITAHVVDVNGVDGPFAHLKSLQVGDLISIYSFGYYDLYQVTSVDFVKPDDTSVFSHAKDAILTLITCDSYDEATKTYQLRVIVRAKRVNEK